MYFLAALVLAALTSAVAASEPAYQPAQPGSPIKRTAASSGPIVLSGLASDADGAVTVALVTPAPEAGSVRLNDESDYESSSSCKPSSICFDGITCGLRYGGSVFRRSLCDEVSRSLTMK